MRTRMSRGAHGTRRVRSAKPWLSDHHYKGDLVPISIELHTHSIVVAHTLPGQHRRHETLFVPLSMISGCHLVLRARCYYYACTCSSFILDITGSHAGLP